MSKCNIRAMTVSGLVIFLMASPAMALSKLAKQHAFTGDAATEVVEPLTGVYSPYLEATKFFSSIVYEQLLHYEDFIKLQSITERYWHNRYPQHTK